MFTRKNQRKHEYGKLDLFYNNIVKNSDLWNPETENINRKKC